MSQPHDPFSLFDDGQTTVIRPRPGGQGPAEPVRAPAAPPGDGAAVEPAFATGRNPLVRAAGPLLALASRLTAHADPGDIEGLRQRVIEALRRYEEQATAERVEPLAVRSGHYALCALIDDLILNTPWGSHGAWKERSLSGTFHNDRAAGNRFFDLAERMERDPARFVDVLELMYVCLALGFQGRFRGGRREASSLAEVRERLYAAVRAHRPPVERELSPRWRGMAAAHRPVGAAVPTWVIGVVAAAILGLVYIGFHFKLGGYADQLNQVLATLPPQGEVRLARAGEAAPVPSPAAPRILPEIEQVLAGEIEARLVEATEDAQTVMVRLRNQGLFPSGGVQVTDRYRPILERLGATLDQYAGRVLVVGHSDSVPVSKSARFASNWELSEARAAAVAEILATTLSEPERLRVEGRAETQPLAPNDTEEGRAQNRRVEVMLIK